MIEAMAVVLLSFASPDGQLLESLRRCREIKDDFARLECFDVAFIPVEEEIGAGEEEEIDGEADEGIDGEGTSETESPADRSPVTAQARPAGDSRTAAVVIPAEGGQRKAGQPVELSVGCDGGNLSVSIDWGQYLRREAPEVTVRIDSLPQSRSTWARSEDKHTTQLNPPGGKKARQQKITSFVRELMAGQKLAARVIPRGGTAVTAVFDLSGSKTALSTVRRACAGH